MLSHPTVPSFLGACPSPSIKSFGYTFDLDKGITIDKIDNIRNEVQFEREIIREEREELKKEAAAGWGMPGSKQLVIPDVPEGL